MRLREVSKSAYWLGENKKRERKREGAGSRVGVVVDCEKAAADV